MKCFRTLLCLLNPVTLWFLLSDRYMICRVCGRVVGGAFFNSKLGGWICLPCAKERNKVENGK